MRLRSDYERFEKEYIKMFTTDGCFMGNLNEITDNSIILNPYIEEIFDTEGNKKIELVNEDFVYSRGAVRGMQPFSKKNIEGFLINLNKPSINTEKK